MRTVQLVVAALLVALLPASVTAADLAALSATAERIDALEPFLSRYVGSCAPGHTQRACQENVAQARKAVSGRAFVVRIPDAATLAQARIDGERFVVLVTPFVDGGGLALTHGAPARQDAAGRPVVPYIAIDGTLPPGMMDLEFQRPFRSGAIALEIVFRPEKVWRLPRKGEPGSYEGVAARFLGVQVLDARTGEVIASRAL